ncbi:MAG: ABC transporter permease [Candidatus Bathyarchaeota archaeon]|nr:ABC transporter permease [Candidatus Bathyarchaeota archaeon]
MPLLYPIKHVFRNWKLFTALLIGVALAATFCAAIGVKANLSAEQTMDQQIRNIYTDISFNIELNQTNLPQAVRNITNIEGVKSIDYTASFGLPISTSTDNYTTSYYTQAYSFPSTSRINGEWLNRPDGGIPENQTYIVAGSSLAQRLKVGDNITTIIQFSQPKYWNASYFTTNLTVAGFAEFTDMGYNYIQNNGGIIYYGGAISSASPAPVYVNGASDFSSGYRGDFLVIDWDNTLMKLWNQTMDSSTVNLNFAVNVDRQNLISPWNVEASILNLDTISNRIQNEVLANYMAGSSPNNMLSSALWGYQSNFDQMLINFIWVSIPVLFVAWYLGSTVSDVSFNIRRREIGLLSTKGMSSGQIQRLFLSEAVVIGLIGGALGVVGGLILNQYYLGTVDINSLFTTQLFSPEIAIVTVIFGVILAVISVVLPARRASKMPAVEALRDYMPIETKSRFRFLPWIAVFLGGYKIVVYLLGANVSTMVSQWTYYGGNFFLQIGSVVLVYFDMAMTFFGPFLFFWGLTKIIIRDSTKFQTVASKISSVMGELGALAAKNVRRNPARLAAIAFMVAFIIGFSVQVTGQVASQQDYIVRQVHADIGADVTVTIANASKGQVLLNEIVANVSGIQSATIQRTVYPRVGESYNTMQVRTIEPANWSRCAYYEDGWFGGANVEQMMKDLGGSNNTIILDRSFAKQYGYELYDEIGVNFDSAARKLRVIGFFGPEPKENSAQPIGVTYDSKYANVQSYYYSEFYSYVPAGLFNMTSGSGIYQLENFQTTYLIKLQPGANGTTVAQQIRDMAPTEVVSVNSFDQAWRQSQGLSYQSTYASLQILDIQSLGLIFAVISASVGTALIAIVSLKERSREATLMSVRGLSFRQLVWMFITESMAIITFAVILGVVVGVIIVYGSVTSANNALYTAQLVTQRLIYPADALATIGTYIALIYAATVGAILVMSSQYVTKLDKMVRAR